MTEDRTIVGMRVYAASEDRFYIETAGSEELVKIEEYHFPSDLLEERRASAKALACQFAASGELKVAAEPLVKFLDKALSEFTPDYAERKGPDHVIFGWNAADLRLGDLLALRAALAKARGETK